jgi:microtubule-associated protein, RP/EB family
MRARLAKQTKQLQEVLESAEAMERERDFYFSKLRQVEILCQAKENDDDGFVKKIVDILYAEDTSEGEEIASQKMASLQV